MLRFWPCKLPKLWLNLMLSRPPKSHRDSLRIFCQRLCRRMTGEIVWLYDLVLKRQIVFYVDTFVNKWCMLNAQGKPHYATSKFVLSTDCLPSEVCVNLTSFISDECVCCVHNSLVNVQCFTVICVKATWSDQAPLRWQTQFFGGKLAECGVLKFQARRFRPEKCS